MRRACVVVGAGAAGVAMSHALVERDVEHVVLERAEPGDTWARQRWDGFRLNTPGWMNAILGDQPADWFCGRDEVVERLRATAAPLPIATNTAVGLITRRGSTFLVRTDDSEIEADTVVLATGLLNVPRRPSLRHRLTARVLQLHAADYRSPAVLPAGAVLVVGGGQSGCQIAEELVLSGRRVYLATCRVGRYDWHYR